MEWELHQPERLANFAAAAAPHFAAPIRSAAEQAGLTLLCSFPTSSALTDHGGVLQKNDSCEIAGKSQEIGEKSESVFEFLSVKHDT
mgnify:CR=1 FL=1